MFTVTWEFLPAPGREADFVRAYGPLGPWAILFRTARGYVGTELLPVPGKPGWYRTVDTWETREQYEAFRREKGAEYARMDEACGALTADERHIG